MNILGISAGFHDAAATVINRHGDILFAGHSERYSKVKNDANISAGLIEEISKFDINEIAYYERPWAKQLRRLYSGEGIQWQSLTVEQSLRKQLGSWYTELKNKQVTDEIRPLTNISTSSYNHHLSHASAGFQTSPFNRATVVVIDAIGEWDTISIWGAEYNKKGQAKYKKLWGQKYPHSIGLFYSAITKEVGLKPNEEEYILMGMAAYGKTTELLPDILSRVYIKDDQEIIFRDNLHTGITSNWRIDNEAWAWAAQEIVEKLIYNVIRRSKSFDWSTNLVYMGGVALNCLANRNLGDYYDNIWIMPNPGDAGSSLGAAALAYGQRINWTTAFLGHDIPGGYPVNDALDHLVTTGIVGVASGRAEFGPRALGNRSLLADPRGPDIKDRVNEIKRRQKFRPFAPVILAELADQYFDMYPGWESSPYMQSVAQCKRTDFFPAIVHYDGSSRVQTVPKDGSGIRELLEKWYVLTGCPMLLNTSLNIRGEPMVNDRDDADRFEKLYNVPVIS
jgi:carbamoyltransferase